MLKTKKAVVVYTILLAVSLSFSGSAQTDYRNFPDYKEVVETFFATYSLREISATHTIRFEKRRTGWHIAMLDYAQNLIKTRDEIFWDSKKRNYQSIDFAKITDTSENVGKAEKFIDGWSERNFAISPYFGYPGWDRELIRDFKDAKNPSDTLIYALGRAYSSYASNLISDNTGYAENDIQYDLPEGKNCLTPEQLATYRKYRYIAIQLFRKVEKRNPLFETIVGTIGVKADNEHMVSFLDLRTFQNEQEAMSELVPDLYNAFFTAAARNYLSSCPLNAILITNGDNDTYPLLYVQAFYKFRTDVMVVNFSLLNTERYIFSLREQILDAPALPFSLNQEEVSKARNQVIYLKEGPGIPMDLVDLISYIKSDGPDKHPETTNYMTTIENKSFSLHDNENRIEWDINDHYLLRSNLMILDYLSVVRWSRPLCFATTVADDLYMGLDDYLLLEGVAYSFTPVKKTGDPGETGTVNRPVLYDNLLNKFDWVGIESAVSNEKQVCSNYRHSFRRLATSLVIADQKDSAMTVLNKCIELFPDSIIPYDYSMIEFIEDYYKLNAFGQGNDIALKLIANLKSGTTNKIDSKHIDPASMNELILERIRNLAVEFGQSEVIKALDE